MGAGGTDLSLHRHDPFGLGFFENLAARPFVPRLRAFRFARRRMVRVDLQGNFGGRGRGTKKAFSFLALLVFKFFPQVLVLFQKGIDLLLFL